MSRKSFHTMTLVVAVCVWGGLPLSMASAQQIGQVPNEPITEAQPLPNYGGPSSIPAPEVLPQEVLSEGGSSEESMVDATGYAMPQQSAYTQGVAGPMNANGMRLPGKLVVPPYYNWHRVVRRPIWRTPVVYNRYWPNHYYTGGQAWSGVGAAQPLPVVTHPTDTTQMGVYYQQVPMWQPNPRMVPPTPWPWDWHYTVPAQAVYGRGEWNTAERAGYGTGYQFVGEEGTEFESYEEE